jgi:hypothetical protein
MKRASLILAALAVVLYVSAPAKAGTITYEDQAQASGTLGASSFFDVFVTVEFTGDTANVTGGSGFFSNSVGTATVIVPGVGTATFTDTMDVFDNQFAQAAGIGDSTLNGSVLDTFHSAFSSYDLKSAIGPLSGAPFFRSDLTYGTTAGGLNFSAVTGNSTFTATTGSPTPEPASLLLLGSGLVALSGSVRKRLKKS